MPFILALALFVGAGSLTACGTAPKTTWRGRAFEVVRSVRDLPGPIRRRLLVEGVRMEGMADVGAPFNRSDLIENPSWPTRRFALAAKSADSWVVAYEHGGFAYWVSILLFDTPAALPQELTRSSQPPTSLHELLASLPD